MRQVLLFAIILASWLYTMSGDNDHSEELEEVVRMVNDSELSSIKSVVHGIVRIISDPRSNAKDLKEIIEIDPPLTGKVLRVANSTYYAPRARIGEIMQAIVYIGFDTLRDLALSQKVCDIFKKGEPFDGYSRSALWKHSVAVALFGKMIYRREFRESGENAYATGLLHGIGIIAEDQFFQEEFNEALVRSRVGNKNLSTAEEEIFGFDHARIGMAVADSWNLPQELVEAIGFHHAPDEAPPVNARLVSTVYVADHCCQREGIGFTDSPYDNNGNFQKCLDMLGIGQEALDLILTDVKQELAGMGDQGLL